MEKNGSMGCNWDQMGHSHMAIGVRDSRKKRMTMKMNGDEEDTEDSMRPPTRGFPFFLSLSSPSFLFSFVSPVLHVTLTLLYLHLYIFIPSHPF